MTKTCVHCGYENRDDRIICVNCKDLIEPEDDDSNVDNSNDIISTESVSLFGDDVCSGDIISSEGVTICGIDDIHIKDVTASVVNIIKQSEVSYYLIANLIDCSKVIHAIGNTEIRGNTDHNQIIIKTGDNNKIILEIEEDLQISSKNPLNIILKGMKAYVQTDLINYISINGKDMKGRGEVELTPGDTIRLCPSVSFKYELDIDHPTIIEGCLSLIPNDFKLKDKFVYSYEGKRYANAINMQEMDKLDLRLSKATFRSVDTETASAINKDVLGMRYRRIMRELAGGASQ